MLHFPLYFGDGSNFKKIGPKKNETTKISQINKALEVAPWAKDTVLTSLSWLEVAY